MKTQELTLDGVADLPQKETLRHIAARLWADPEVAALWLGGSFARGAADENSDFDLRVAVRPEALPRWQKADASAQDVSGLIKETVAGMHTLRWEGTALYQLLLADGLIVDLLAQSVERDPPDDFTLILGCRDAAFGQKLASAHLPQVPDPTPADPAVMCQALVDFWIGSHKHLRVLSRDLDLLAVIGLGLEQSALLRLWYADATGRDQGAQRPTIHSLTEVVRSVTAAVGPHSLDVFGAARANRAEIEQAVEASRDEAATVGRRLAARFGFAYPEVLEQTVRRCWQEYRENNARPAAPA